LYNKDRIIFGTNSTFLLNIPEGEVRPDNEAIGEIDWEFCQNEMSSKNNKLKKDEEEQ
jgi:hypothetical protein